MTRYGDIAQPINSLRALHGSIEPHTTLYFPSRRESRVVSGYTCGPTPVLFVAPGPWVRSAPGFPCALSEKRGQNETQSSDRSCRENADACGARNSRLPCMSPGRIPILATGIDHAAV